MLKKITRKIIVVFIIFEIMINLFMSKVMSKGLIDEVQKFGTRLSASSSSSKIDQIHFIREDLVFADDGSFIRRGNSDAILIETNGCYGLIDASTEYNGPIVRNYLGKVMGDKKLDFIIMTHYHLDHIGGFTSIADFINDKTVVFYKNNVTKTNVYKYNEIMQALQGKGAIKCEVSEKKFTEIKQKNTNISNTKFIEGSVSNTNVDDSVYFNIGDYEIRLYNLYNISEDHENSNSIVTLIKKGTQKIALMGDQEAMIAAKSGNSLIGAENQFADIIGKVSLLKAGHHGYGTANSLYFIQKLKPEYTVLTSSWEEWENELKPAFRYAAKYLRGIGGKVYVTRKSSGAIVANIGDGKITINNYDKNYNNKGAATSVEGIDYTGWIYILEKIYDPSVDYKYRIWKYIDSDGKEAKGWKNIEGRWYYFCKSKDEFEGYQEGQMVTGWKKLEYSGKYYWFYFVENKEKYTGSFVGQMLTGRRQVIYNGKSSYYYFCKKNNEIDGYVKGAMISNATYGGYKYDNKGANPDTVIPNVEVSYSEKTMTNEDIKVTIKTNEEVKKISGWTLSSNQMELTKKYKANRDETVSVTDLAGNTKKVTVSIKNIDKTAPTLIVTFSPEKLTNGNVTVTITSNEKIQSVKGWTLSSDKKKLTKEYSDNDIETVKVKDLVGNITTKEIKVDNIDKEALRLKVSYSTKEATNKDVTATITSVNKEIQSISGNGWTIDKSNKKKATKKYAENGSETVTVKDAAGNTKNVAVKIDNIDKIKPDLKESISPSKPTNKNVTVKITSTEQIEIVSGEGWKITNSNMALTKTYNKNETEMIKVKDLAGNVSTKEIKIKNIDKEGPKLEVSYSTDKPIKGNVIMTIKSTNEEIQEVEGWKLLKDKKTLTKTFEENGEEKVEVLDIAGNITDVTVAVGNIITEGPTITSEVYNVKSFWIERIKQNTTINNMIKNILIQATNIKYYNNDDKEISTTEKAKTGMKIVLDDQATYTLLVTGDVDGDGLANENDMLEINRHRLLENGSLTGIYFEAGDVTEDGEVDEYDMLEINRHRLGIPW